jgi:hypothetical protein
MSTNKKLMATKMLELSSTAGYRKAIKEMNALQRTFSDRRFIYLHSPSLQTQEQLRDEGFTVERTKITEYVQFKISW